MANAIYPTFKTSLGVADTNVSLNVDTTADGPYCALVDTGTYTYSAAHQFYSSLSGVVGTDQEVATPTLTNGLIDGGDVTYTAVSGNSVEAIVLVSGFDSRSRRCLRCCTNSAMRRRPSRAIASTCTGRAIKVTRWPARARRAPCSTWSSGA